MYIYRGIAAAALTAFPKCMSEKATAMTAFPRGIAAAAFPKSQHFLRVCLEKATAMTAFPRGIAAAAFPKSVLRRQHFL